MNTDANKKEWGKLYVLYFATFASIGPLLIENFWLIRAGLLFFVLGLAYLLYIPAKTQLNRLEKIWIGIVLSYVVIFILSFLLRPPYTDDGVWRLSAPGLMLLVLIWFVAVVRHQLQWDAAKAVSVSIIVWALVVAVWEQIGWQPDLLSYSYKMGMYVSGIGAMGTIVPIGAGLALAVALHEKKSKVWWLLALVGLILVLLLKKRTPLALYGVMLSVWAGWMLLRHGGLALWQRTLLALGVIAVLGVGAWFQRDLVRNVWGDYMAAVEHGNYATSLGLRYKMLELGANLIAQKPLTGWGPNAYKSEGLWPLLEQENVEPRVSKPIAKFTHLHNQFVMDWVLSGILGLMSVILVLLYPVFLSARKYRDSWGVGLLLSGLGVGIVFVMLFGALFTYTYTTTAIMMVLSVIVAISSRQQT